MSASVTEKCNYRKYNINNGILLGNRHCITVVKINVGMLQHSQTFQCIYLLLRELQGNLFLWSLVRLSLRRGLVRSSLHRGLMLRLPGLGRLVLDPARMRQRNSTREPEIGWQLHWSLSCDRQASDPLERRGNGRCWPGRSWPRCCWPRPRASP